MRWEGFSRRKNAFKEAQLPQGESSLLSPEPLCNCANLSDDHHLIIPIKIKVIFLSEMLHLSWVCPAFRLNDMLRLPWWYQHRRDDDGDNGIGISITIMMKALVGILRRLGGGDQYENSTFYNTVWHKPCKKYLVISNSVNIWNMKRKAPPEVWKWNIFSGEIFCRSCYGKNFGPHG